MKSRKCTYCGEEVEGQGFTIFDRLYCNVLHYRLWKWVVRIRFGGKHGI